MFAALRWFLSALRDFVFPPICLGCDQHEVEQGLVCTACQHRLLISWLRVGSIARLAPIIHLRALGPYLPPFSNLVHELKYRNRRSLARLLGQALAGLVRSDYLLAHADLLVPIPLHPARLRERGYNQSLLLATQTSQLVEIPVEEPLRRVRNTKSQINLRPEQRTKNLEQAFALRPGAAVIGKAIVLVDDVTTTGATLRAAARVLQAAGARAVYGLAVALAWGQDRSGLL